MLDEDDKKRRGMREIEIEFIFTAILVILAVWIAHQLAPLPTQEKHLYPEFGFYDV